MTFPSSTVAVTRTRPAGVSRFSSVTGSSAGTIPVSMSTVVTQIVFVPDMGGYSVCSMITKAASAAGSVGGSSRLQLAAGYPRGSRNISLRRASSCSRRWIILSNIVSPGTSGTPSTITRPGSPQACASTAVIRRANPTPRYPVLAAAPGTESMSCRVYQCAGLDRIWVAGPLSTTSPRYNTKILSAT